MRLEARQARTVQLELLLDCPQVGRLLRPSRRGRSRCLRWHRGSTRLAAPATVGLARPVVAAPATAARPVR
eukprot:2733874-Lingulodinium_polyedra.AAC.1